MYVCQMDTNAKYSTSNHNVMVFLCNISLFALAAHIVNKNISNGCSGKNSERVMNKYDSM